MNEPSTIAPVLANLGPGGALSAIGSFLALLGAILLAVLGFLWYPIKRLLRRRRERKEPAPPGPDLHGNPAPDPLRGSGPPGNPSPDLLRGSGPPGKDARG